MDKPSFDYVIIGAGCAGISLAWELLHSSRHFESLLIIDRNDPRFAPSRYLSFWSKDELPFAPAVRHSWDKIIVKDSFRVKEIDTNPYRLQLITSKDYAAYLFPKILQDKRVTFRDNPEKSYNADWVFNSSPLTRYPPGTFFMHSAAWEVRSPDDRFQPDTMTFCDFPVEVEPGAFYYTMPLSRNHAVIYSVQWKMSPRARKEAGREALKKYLNTSTFDTIREEYGVIPLLTSAPRRTGRKELAIGARGGLVRGCTGYGLTRIWRDSRSIAFSLEKHGHPFDIPADSRITKFGNTAFRHLIRKHPGNARIVLNRVFDQHKAAEGLEFLEGNSAALPLLKVMIKVTPWPFLVNFQK